MPWALVSAIVTFFSTMAGGLAALRWPRRVDLLMALAGGVVLAAALFDLLPDAVARAADIGMSTTVPVGAVAVGYLTFHVAERVLHRHGDVEGADPAGLAGALGFVIHSFFDGLAIGLGFRVSSALGILVAVAVIGHDFSDGLNTVSYLVAHRQPAERSKWWLVADATTPVVGAAVATLAPVPAAVFPVALGFFSGLFVYAASTNLLPRAQLLPLVHGLSATLGGAGVMFLIRAWRSALRGAPLVIVTATTDDVLAPGGDGRIKPPRKGDAIRAAGAMRSWWTPSGHDSASQRAPR
jgi:ZIP family zinc transporter